MLYSNALNYKIESQVALRNIQQYYYQFVKNIESDLLGLNILGHYNTVIGRII